MTGAAVTLPIPVEPLRPEAFSSFGTVLTLPAAPPDIETTHNRYWDHEGLFQAQGVAQLGFLEVRWRPFIAASLERHLTHTQAFIPLAGTPFIKVVAPPTAGDQPDPAAVRAFYLDGSEGVVLHHGTWHHLLFPLVPVGRALLLLQAGTKDHDMQVVTLPQPIEVTL